MHGRPRKPAQAVDATATVAKAAKLRDLLAQLLHSHHNHIYTKEALLASAKLLEINPEIYTGWNYRKLAFQHNLSVVTDVQEVKSAVEDELRLVELALRRNPKSYGAWYHRKWVVRQNIPSVGFEREFRLLDQLLKLDTRNFHAWNYRRFVSRLRNVSEEEELNFTMDMINTNFSNYSAWHNRSIALSNLLRHKAKGFESRKNILSEEFELVQQALFTDPSDQSGWFYHLWLVDQTSTADFPRLISVWPSNGSRLSLSAEKGIDVPNLVSSPNSFQCYCLQKGLLPLILFFDRHVRGIESFTLLVNSKPVSNENFEWKPLSVTNSKETSCWLACLNISDGSWISSQANSVEVSLQIGSISGSQFSYPLQMTFTIELNHTYPQQGEGDSLQEPFLWNYSVKSHFQDSPDILSFDQLNIHSDNVKERTNWHLDTLYDEISLFKEMYEEDNKFVKLTLARLLIAYDAMKSHSTSPMQRRENREEALKLFDDLIKLDTSHKRYYEDERSSLLLDQVMSDKESILKHCRCFDKPVGPVFSQQICLQLNGLSLTCIGFVERFLWVQMLDLSQNKLRSIAGLEALQLLVCLNLSQNQIGSFTALEPLKKLMYLKVLNLSFNELGTHPTDTTRYLCLSPLSHTVDVTGMIERCRKDNINATEYWEAILLFESMHLAQLDIKGNAVSVESFTTMLKKILPLLKWLDGVQV